MADVAQIIGCIMSELIQAQKQALEQSKDIALERKDNPLMCLLPIPGLKIDNLDLSLKFIIDETPEQTPEAIEDTPNDNEVEVAKREAVIETLSTKVIENVFNSESVKPLLSENKVTARELRVLRALMTKVLRTKTEQKTAQINQATILADTKILLTKSKLKTDSVMGVVTQALDTELNQYKNSLNKYLSTPALPKISKPRFVVDKASLAEATPELISTINMSLSLDEYEWADGESGLTLRTAQ